MSISIKTLPNSVEAKYSIMLSKLIALLQFHLLQLTSLNRSHNPNQKSIQPQNNSQKYKFLLKKMKLFEQQHFISHKYSQLCQPLLNSFEQSDSTLSDSSETPTQKSLSSTFKHSRLASLYHSLDRQQLQQNSPSIKHSLDLKKPRQGKHIICGSKGPKFNQHFDLIKNSTGKRNAQTLRDFHKYQNLNESHEIPACMLSISTSCKKSFEPGPGKTQFQNKSCKQLKIEENQENEPTLPNFKNEIILSKNNFLGQISNRTMTEFSKFKYLQKIDEQAQNEVNLDLAINEKQIFSFEIAQTPNGTVYGKQEQVNFPSKNKLAMYKRFIDRTHLKRVNTEFT